MNKYIVYKHTFPNNKVYIGITSCIKPNGRWRNGKGYETQYVYRAIKKYGWNNIKHEILYDNLFKEQAEEKEILLIKLYKSNDRKYGYNIENGGHINKVSKETKLKLKGNKFAKGHKLDEEQRKRMTELSRTPEARKKLSKAKSKKIICIETGVVYENSLIAQQETGIGFGNIRNVCMGLRKTAGGYHWRDYYGK